MRHAPSRSVMLSGTDQEVESPIALTAGKLTAEFEAGNLRYIRFNGIEIIRAISFIVRDRNWGTYSPEISNLTVRSEADAFEVTYNAVARDANHEFHYAATITGWSKGELKFAAKGLAVTDFLTARTGFVVLHPIEGVAGQPATIEQVDGSISETSFPELIDPVQPMMNLRAITHSFAAGAKVVCRMLGDTFEMEDQRNWTDASFKTYVRPLALPWPYRLVKGSTVEQAVMLEIEGKPASRSNSAKRIEIVLGSGKSPVPSLGAGLAPEDVEGVKANLTVLRKLALKHVICHHDPRQGHDQASLAASLSASKDLGATPWLEAIVSSIDEFDQEVAALAASLRQIGEAFPVVLLSPAADLKCVLPGSPWPPCPPSRDLFACARRHFPNARIGGGMFSFFTELNRKRPPVELLDFVNFTTSALVHAGDDRSVTESLQSIPYIARSVRSFIGNKPYAVGPSAIAMRDNPYGAATADNPNDIRQAMNRNDPRQRSLLGAAWNLAYFAHFAYGGADAIALGNLVGPFGAIHTLQAWPQTWYDKGGGLFPVYHVLRGLAALNGDALVEVKISAPREVQALAATHIDGDTNLWIANLTADKQSVSLKGIEGRRVAGLDTDSFATAAVDPDLLMKPSKNLIGETIDLDAYELIHITT